MATVPRKGEFYDTESASGEWARGENYGDGTTGDERVAAARAKDYVAPKAEPAVKQTGTPDMPSTPAKKRSFKEEFAAARDGSIFEWNGKMYKKEYAAKKGVSKPAAKATAPAAKADTKAAPSSMKKDVESFNSTAAKPAAKPASKADRYKEEARASAMRADKASYDSKKSDMYKPTRDAVKELPGALRRLRADMGESSGVKSRVKMDKEVKLKQYKSGGSVRGAGLAERGVRKCKMV